MKKNLFITVLFLFLLNSIAIGADFNTCEKLYNDGKYKDSSKCFFYRLQADNNDIQSRFYYAASLYYDRQLHMAYEQYQYIADNYPNTQIGNYSKQEAEKVRQRINHINTSKANDKGDYVSELSHTSKWLHMPIKVYIEPSLYKTTAVKAFLEWENKTYSKVRFVLVSNPNAAKIKVHFVDKFGPNEKSEALGYTLLRYWQNVNLSAQIKVLKSTPSGDSVSEEQMYHVVLHEIGHALGITGHSSNSNDIMYPNTFTNQVSLSKRDLNTINAVYK